jgi:hypothetical protein
MASIPKSVPSTEIALLTRHEAVGDLLWRTYGVEIWQTPKVVMRLVFVREWRVVAIQIEIITLRIQGRTAFS